MNALTNFFDPNLRTSELFAMGSAGHLALIVIMFALLGVLIAFRSELHRLRQSRGFMAGTAAAVLSLETASYVFKVIYPCDAAFERLPLQLCSTLKIAITVLILLKRYDLAKHVSVIAIGCGFISFVNLNLNGESFGNFAFWHYVVGHYYLFLAPTFLFLTGDHRYDFRFHMRSSLLLGAWSLLIFFVNWAFDTNYMYSGPHNQVKVPFLPDAMMVWPMNYVSYVLIALVLLNGTYAILKVCQNRMAAPRPASLEPALAIS